MVKKKKEERRLRKSLIKSFSFDELTLRVNRRRIKRVFSFFLFALLLGATAYFFYKYYSLSQFVRKTNDIEIVVKKVARHIILPKNEIPTMAVVTDEKKLKKKDFFKQAKKGDKVLIYKDAKKAILYRSSIDKIIEVAPIRNLNEGNKLSDQSGINIQSSLKKAKVVLYNGTSRTGETFSYEDILKKEFANQVKVLDKDFAKKRDYKENLVIDLTEGKNQDLVKRLADRFKAKISVLPEYEEATSEADILIIVGFQTISP